MEKKRNVRCSSVTRLGRACRAYAVHGTDPPRCVAHGGGSDKHGAPKGNKNAAKHGFYADGWASKTSIDMALSGSPLRGAPASNRSADGGRELTATPESIDLQQTIINIIEDLYYKHFTLSDYIDRHAEEMTLPEYAHLLSLHAQMATRFGRLLRDLVVITPDENDWVKEAMRRAYEELSDKFGVNLTADPDYVPKTEKQT